MSEYVIASVLKECRKNWGHNLAPESRSFSMGAAAKIGERVLEMIKEAKPEGYESTSLVVQELYKTEQDANAAFIKASGTTLVSKASRSTHINPKAYAAGKEYGNGIGLNNQVTARNQLKIGG